MDLHEFLDKEVGLRVLLPIDVGTKVPCRRFSGIIGRRSYNFTAGSLTAHDRPGVGYFHLTGKEAQLCLFYRADEMIRLSSQRSA